VFGTLYKVVQIWPGLMSPDLHTNSPGHIWTNLYIHICVKHFRMANIKFITIIFLFFFTNLMHKFFVLMHLLHSSTCLEHYYAHLQEDNCISTAYGIVTVFRWLFSTQVMGGLVGISPLVTCVLNSHLKTVTILDAVLIQLSSWRWAQ